MNICGRQHSFGEIQRLHVSTVFPPAFNDMATDQTTHRIQLHKAASYRLTQSTNPTIISEQGKQEGKSDCAQPQLNYYWYPG